MWVGDQNWSEAAGLGYRRGKSRVRFVRLSHGLRGHLAEITCWRHLESSGIIWNHLQSSGSIWNHLEASGLFRTHLVHLESSGGIWRHLESSEATWRVLESSRDIWSHPAFCFVLLAYNKPVTAYARSRSMVKSTTRGTNPQHTFVCTR